CDDSMSNNTLYFFDEDPYVPEGAVPYLDDCDEEQIAAHIAYVARRRSRAHFWHKWQLRPAPS
ncbi:hypothetical protein IWW55_006391, partial [Coemansia sp. RSA 2706]